MSRNGREVEAYAQALARDPDRFERAVEEADAARAANDARLIDELCQHLAAAGGEDAAAAARVRRAWKALARAREACQAALRARVLAGVRSAYAQDQAQDQVAGLIAFPRRSPDPPPHP